MKLEDKVLELHRALTRRRIPHAFGGAIALAYWVADARGTADIDLNVFVPVEECERVLAGLPKGVAVPDDTAEKVVGDGQVRLWWDETPVDLFFSYAPIHEEAAEHRTNVLFMDTEIPILGPTELAVFKAMFDRLRDWGDIEEMAAADTLDLDAVRRKLREMSDDKDERVARLDEIEERAKRRRSQ